MKTLSLRSRVALAVLIMIGIILTGTAMGFLGVKYCIYQGEKIADEHQKSGQFLNKSIELARSAQVAIQSQLQEFHLSLLEGATSPALALPQEGFQQKSGLAAGMIGALEAMFQEINWDRKLIDNCRQQHQRLTAQCQMALKQFDPKQPESAVKAHQIIQENSRLAFKAIDDLRRRVLP